MKEGISVSIYENIGEYKVNLQIIRGVRGQGNNAIPIATEKWVINNGIKDLWCTPCYSEDITDTTNEVVVLKAKGLEKFVFDKKTSINLPIAETMKLRSKAWNEYRNLFVEKKTFKEFIEEKFIGGRDQKWLHKKLTERDIDITYKTMNAQINSGKIKLNIAIEIANILDLDFNKIRKSYKANNES